ncbi:phosphoprotein phosphatase [Moniliophthora roreri MCA 2997]|uniref:Mitochondrial import inner membrane translocase subunit TIM50 n=1 Tax=Moniliophthora roreri (strain MCA 2997) TaxID=1381753 RepID=V2XBW4_MONRO|nr:phosphoprotein phosphatase [Moniliophthora roreri MCA 2997]
MGVASIWMRGFETAWTICSSVPFLYTFLCHSCYLSRAREDVSFDAMGHGRTTPAFAVHCIIIVGIVSKRIALGSRINWDIHHFYVLMPLYVSVRWGLKPANQSLVKAVGVSNGISSFYLCSVRSQTRSFLTTTTSSMPKRKNHEQEEEPASTTARKLIVLDLNGALVFRPALEDSGRREIHPRPYVPSFRKYLSHPKTMAWLDTMVWSSAQPHNVKKMVEKCFGTKTCLKACWARDKLGLDQKSYGQNVQTTKDLSKIWKTHTFTSSPSLEFLIPGSSKRSHNHNTQTTILLDDSPHKTHLQPFNHICIREYNKEMWTADLGVNVVMCGEVEAKEEALSEPKAKKVKLDVDITELGCTHGKAKSRSTYDETILAIIGILEALKDESDVAAWARNGGLLQTGEEAVTKAVDDEKPGTMWFDDVQVFNHWVEKGRTALTELEIAIDSGVQSRKEGEASCS